MITFTLLVFLFVSISNCDCEKNACSLKLCKCLEHKVECSDTNLTYIPVLPGHTRKLFFDSNYLPLINRHTFSNITHLRYLDVLTLQSCHITNITTNTFNVFKKLSRLRLSYNPLTMGSLLNVFSDLKNSFYYSLILIDIGLKYIPNGLFKNNFTLFYLDISKNSLETLNFTEFNSLGLRVLKTENNLIETVVMDKMENLRNLSLMSNLINSLPDFCHGNSYFPLLSYLNIQTYNINEYIPSYLNCLKNLSKLVLNNSISSIQSRSFQELSSLTELSLSQQTRSLKLHQYSFNNQHLVNLKLVDNDIQIQSLDPLAFRGCPRLKYLIISGNYLSDKKRTTCTKLSHILLELNYLQHLDLSKNRLNEVPKSIQNMTKLQYLSLYENRISTWKNRFWDGSIKLTTLDLGRNSIRKISKEMFPAKLRSQLKTISLQNNPIECICDNVWLIEWMNSDHKKIKYFPRGYNCINMTERVCLRNNPIYTSITGVSCVLLLIFIVVSIVFKYRWFIKYQIYIWRHQPKLLNNMAERQYLYDVFVSYSAEDNWVLNDLVPQLEENEGMKLCIHERDFQGGRMIIDNIVESIENSRRVLIILSNNFARSEWCQFEMTLAQKNVLNRDMEPLSVVLLEEIDSENMSNSLQALLKTTTYITWYNDVENINLFWDRLKKSLR